MARFRGVKPAVVTASGAMPDADNPKLRKNVGPYHSGSQRDEPVWHHRTDCPDGSRIRSSHLVRGRGGLPLCGKCLELRENDLNLTDE